MTLSDPRRPAWSSSQSELLAAARARIDRGRLAERLRQIVSIPSPTGEELPLARHLAEELRTSGLQASVQQMDARQGNAIGRLGGTSGPQLLLYAPIDTAFSGNPDEDLPWLGPRPTQDFQAAGSIDAGKVIGLSAENPKSFVAVILEAVTALAATGATFPGGITAGFGAGGMPTSGRPGFPRRNIGHGVGCAYMLERGVQPDAAIIVKPGYSVSWEEVGLTWHTIRIRGARNYTGIRHRMPYRNPILQVPAVVEALEAWFADYSARHTSGLVSPQGSIGALSAGSGDLTAFTPLTCDLFIDVRVSPRSSPQEVQAELNDVLAGLRQRLPDLDVTSEMTVAVPGTHTPPDHWLVRSLVDAWELREGRPHEAAAGTSGATDAAILRGHGIPTARIGPPPAATPSPYPGFSMGVADIDSLVALADLLLYPMVEVATMSLQELRRSAGAIGR